MGYHRWQVCNANALGTDECQCDVYNRQLTCRVFLFGLARCVPQQGKCGISIRQFNINMPFNAVYLYHSYFVLRDPQNSKNPLMNVVRSYRGACKIERAYHSIVAFCHFDTQNTSLHPIRLEVKREQTSCTTNKHCSRYQSEVRHATTTAPLHSWQQTKSNLRPSGLQRSDSTNCTTACLKFLR